MFQVSGGDRRPWRREFAHILRRLRRREIELIPVHARVSKIVGGFGIGLGDCPVDSPTPLELQLAWEPVVKGDAG